MNQFSNDKCAASALFHTLHRRNERHTALQAPLSTVALPPVAPLQVMCTKVIPLISNIFDYETFFSPPKRHKKCAVRGIIIQSMQGERAHHPETVILHLVMKNKELQTSNLRTNKGV